MTTSELIELAKYIEATCLLSRTWSPDRWSVFGQSVRTNNDVEGWHNGLKNLGHRDMPFYRLIETLERKSKWTSLSCRLVRESKLENMFSFYRSINIYINNCILQPKNILKELVKPKGV